MTRFETAVAMIDAANAEDPNRVHIVGGERPAEVVYSERMTRMLHAFAPGASEELQLAVRAQHLRRWLVPRSGYPMDRAGYHRWRNELKRKHAAWTAEILASCGYDAAPIARVAALIRKENLKGDAEGQTLEDVACLVFLAHYAEAFAGKHSQEPGKLVSIVRKTWNKMSEQGHAAAPGMISSDVVRRLVDAALDDTGSDP